MFSTSLRLFFEKKRSGCSVLEFDLEAGEHHAVLIAVSLLESLAELSIFQTNVVHLLTGWITRILEKQNAADANFKNTRT